MIFAITKGISITHGIFSRQHHKSTKSIVGNIQPLSLPLYNKTNTVWRQISAKTARIEQPSRNMVLTTKGISTGVSFGLKKGQRVRRPVGRRLSLRKTTGASTYCVEGEVLFQTTILCRRSPLRLLISAIKRHS